METGAGREGHLTSLVVAAAALLAAACGRGGGTGAAEGPGDAAPAPAATPAPEWGAGPPLTFGARGTSCPDRAAPLPPTPGPPLEAEPVTLSGAREFHADDDGLIWAAQRRIERLAASATTATTLFDLPSTLPGAIWNVAADATHLYFDTFTDPSGGTPTGDGALHRVRRDGGGFETIATGLRQRGHLSVDAHSVQLHSATAITAWPKAGGAPHTLVAGAIEGHVLGDDTHLFLVEPRPTPKTDDAGASVPEWRVRRVAKVGGATVVLATWTGGVYTAALSGDSLYFVGTLLVPPPEPSSGLHLVRLPKSGGLACPVGSLGFRTERIQLDGSGVYWSGAIDSDLGFRHLWHLDLEGRGRTAVAAKMITLTSYINPTLLTLDGASIYFSWDPSAASPSPTFRIRKPPR